MKYQRYGLTVERPNAADEGSPVNDKVITRWIKRQLLELIDSPNCHWTSIQSGDAAAHTLRRQIDYTPRFHILIFHGRDAFCADLTEEEAAQFLMT